MLEQRVVWVRFGERLLIGVSEIEVVKGEDNGGEVMGRPLEGGSDYGDLDRL